jgi:hypothetical protein
MLFSFPATAQTCPRSGTNLQPRLIIPLFRYEPTSDSTARSQFELFRSVVGTKLSTLAEEAKGAAIHSGVQTTNFPDGLTLYLRAGQPLDDTLQDLTKRRQYWEQSDSLQLLRGRVWLGVPGKPFVQSDIYIGELRGAFPRPEVVVRLAVDPDEVATTNDSHSVVTYFALAMEARRLGCDQAIARSFLARASSILRDIQRREKKLSGDLAALDAVVDQELKR